MIKIHRQTKPHSLQSTDQTINASGVCCLFYFFRVSYQHLKRQRQDEKHIFEAHDDTAAVAASSRILFI